jgi:multiple sugar transport system permease protein
LRSSLAPAPGAARAKGRPGHPAARLGPLPLPRRPRPAVSRKTLPYLLLIPALIAELLIHIVPMLLGVWMSLRKLTEFFIRNWTNAPGAGLSNYRIAVSFSGPIGSALVHSFVITVALTAVIVGFSWLIGFTAAVLMERPFGGRALLRTLFLIPYALPIFAEVITWRFMFQQNGAVNAVASEAHLAGKPPFWLLGGGHSFAALAIVMIWRLWPFAFLVITAGLQSVPPDLYEAARIDGAGEMRRVRSVTMPLLRPVNVVLVLVLFLWVFNEFNSPYYLFDQPPPSADMISVHIYNASFTTWNFGLGSAMSVLMMVFLAVVTGGFLLWRRRREGAIA